MRKGKTQKRLQNSLKIVVNTLTKAVSKRAKMLGGYLSRTKKTYKKHNGKTRKMRKTQRLFSSLLPSVLNK